MLERLKNNAASKPKFRSESYDSLKDKSDAKDIGILTLDRDSNTEAEGKH